MLIGLRQILKDADEEGYAVPAFNVYNMETVMGVMQAAEELKSPVIMQFYDRLATGGFADFLCPVILKAADKADVPVCMHLDHGASYGAAAIAVKNGATGVMLDFSLLPMGENIRKMQRATELLDALEIGVEGEIGHVGTTSDKEMMPYTTVEEAREFADKTKVSALAIAVGTAHGRYKKAPVLAIDRIKEIKEAVKIPLVLHGGSGVPDGQIKAAIEAGIRKVNFGTDLCYAFLDGVFSADRKKVAIDIFMGDPINGVKKFAMEKIRVLGANDRI